MRMTQSTPSEAPSAPSTTALVLVNLGTPQAPTAHAVRRYLRQFLSDRRVVDLPRVLWWPLLNLVKGKKAEAAAIPLPVPAASPVKRAA